jgi:hypothetical protein
MPQNSQCRDPTLLSFVKVVAALRALPSRKRLPRGRGPRRWRRPATTRPRRKRVSPRPWSRECECACMRAQFACRSSTAKSSNFAHSRSKGRFCGTAMCRRTRTGWWAWWADVAWGYQAMLGASVMHIADRDRITRISNGAAKAGDGRAASEPIVEFCIGGWLALAKKRRNKDAREAVTVASKGGSRRKRRSTTSGR